MDIGTMKKVLLVLTSHDTLGDTGEATGYFVGEAAHPWKVFRDAGYFVDFASIEGGQPPQDGLDEEDPIQVEFTTDETVKASLYNTPKIAVVDPSQYHAVFLVGGHGTMWDFTGNKNLQKLIATVYDSMSSKTWMSRSPSRTMRSPGCNPARAAALFSSTEPTTGGVRVSP